MYDIIPYKQLNIVNLLKIEKTLKISINRHLLFDEI